MVCCNDIPSVINYGSSAVYKELPTPEQVASGVIPLDSLPAAWWNAMWACNNIAFNCARTYVGQLISELNTVLTQAGITANCTCVDQLYQSITKLRRIVGDADYPGAVKSSSCPGEVSINEYGVMTANCVGNAANLTTTAKTLVGAVNELKSTYDCCFTAIGNAGYTTLGNTNGCALGTAAAGTANTAARSDHVHAYPTYIECVRDATNSSCYSRMNYGAAGLTNPVWMAGWNGYELRAVCRATLCVGCAGCAGCATSATSATCAQYAYHDTYTGNADRPIMVTSDNDYNAAGYYTQGTVRSGCNFTYNPATGMLKLKSNGKTACINHQNASYLHIYTDASCIAFNRSIYLPECCYIDRAKTLSDVGYTDGSRNYTRCVGYNGSSEATALGSSVCLLVRSYNSGTCLHHTILSINAACVCVGNAGCATNATNATKSCCACYLYSSDEQVSRLISPTAVYTSYSKLAGFNSDGNMIAVPSDYVCSGTGLGISTHARKSSFIHCGVTFTYCSNYCGCFCASIPTGCNYAALVYGCHCYLTCKCKAGPYWILPGQCCVFGNCWCFCADNATYKCVSVFCIKL